MTPIESGLDAEYAVIWAYGAVTVHLEGDRRELAEEMEAEHRTRRDALLDFFDGHDLEAGGAQPGYDVERVEDADRAAALLLELENAVTTTWRAGLASEDADQRELCLRMYVDSAKALARWKLANDESYAAPWPGRPE